MIYFITFLMVIIFILLIYIFLGKREIRRIRKEIQVIKKEDTNSLLHSESNSLGINRLVKELNALFLDFKNIKIDVDRKNKSLYKMMTNISHDLRTPLTSALGYIDIILTSDISKEEQEKELKIIEERLKRLEELINSFFEFSKIISNNENIELEEVNLIAIIEESMLHYYEDFEKDKRKIDFINNKNKVKLLSNQKLLIRIFDNLIGNSYKHSNSDLRIELKVDNKIQIKFSNGLLYPELDTEKMFDEFYTVDVSRTKSNTGLGLAIAKDFTEQLNGKIYAIKKDELLEIIVEFDII